VPFTQYYEGDKSGSLSWVDHMEYMENFRNAYGIIDEKSERE
jgi:hypothetical protein